MAKFEVVLKNDKARQYDRMALFIVLLNIAIFILTVFYSSEKTIRIIAASGAVLAGLLLAAGNGRIYRPLPLLLITITWGLLGNWWGACICLALGLLFQVSQRPLAVGVGKEAVLYPSFPKKTIQWSELNNLVLKDGLLTIDFKNNKILQSEIINSPVELNEKEFNDFCKEQLR